MLRLGCLIVLIVLVAIPTIAFQLGVPWWGVMLIIIAEAALLVVGGPKLVGILGKKFIIGMFMTKSRVLRDAGAHVHSVQPTERPSDEEESAEERAQLEQAAAETSDNGDDEDADEEDVDDEDEPSLADHRFVLIDFTVTPRPGQSKMSHWEPGEIQLVPIDAKVDASLDPDDNKTLSANVHRMSLVDESGSETTDFDKVVGPGRFRAVFAVPPTMTGRVKFRYYFESFGDLILPS